MAIALSLAAAQLRHRPARWALLVAGVALAAAIPVVSAGAGDTVAAQTVRTTVRQLPPGERSITVLGAGTIYSPAEAAGFDTLVRQQLGRLSAAPIRHELVFHQLQLNGSTFVLGAVDDLPGSVKLIDGRLPRSCTPKRCEVVAFGGDTAAVARSAQALGVVVVGRARRTDPTVLGGDLDPGQLPWLLGDGVDAMSRLDSLSLFARSYGWVTPVDVQRVIALGVPAYLRRSAEVADTIIAKVGGAGLIRPDTTLDDQYHRAALSARRFGLLGGTAAVLLLGFAIVAAVGLRREQAVLVAVLRRRGARVGRVLRVAVLAAGTACIAGAVVGVALGAGVTVGLAQNATVPSWRTIGHALDAAWPAVTALLAGAVAVTVAVLLWPDRDRKVVWHTVELLGAACLGAAWLAASRGTTSLANGNDPLVAALPVLVAVVGGLLAARLWAPLARLAERLVPRRSVAGRIGLLGAIRRPLRPVATTAFLTAAVAVLVFAGAYRATLLDGARDQAAYQVPLDATVTGGPDVTTPLGAPAVPGTRAYRVIRTSAVTRTLDGNSIGVPLVGIERSVLPEVHRWSRVTGTSLRPQTVADRLRPATAPILGPAITATARTVSLDVAGLPGPIDLALWLRRPDGRDVSVALSGSGGRRSGRLPGGGPLQVVAVTLNENLEYATHVQHALGEGQTDLPMVVGTFTFGQVRADGAPIAWPWSGWGSGHAEVSARGDGLRVSIRLQGSQIVLVPGYPPPVELPVVTDPDTARSADHGLLTLTLDQASTVVARIVAVLPRFPAMGDQFVLADQGAVTELLDRTTPGSGPPRELWLAGSPPGGPGGPGASEEPSGLGSRLATAPYDQLTVTLRAPIQHRLVTDPVASGSRLLLVLIAGLALLMAAVAVLLLVLGERRDDAGELYAWEADGLRPATLRRMLFVRALTVVAVAVPFGLAAGLILAQLGATLVAVDAAGVAPVPPLAVSIGAAWTALSLLIGVGLAVALAWLVAARMLRERLPARPELDLR